LAIPVSQNWQQFLKSQRAFDAGKKFRVFVPPILAQAISPDSAPLN